MNNIWKFGNIKPQYDQDIVAIINGKLKTGYVTKLNTAFNNFEKDDEINLEDFFISMCDEINDKFEYSKISKWCYEEDLIKQAVDK